MASTLLLDRDNWDLAVDAIGNIAVASEPYSQNQDVASACRVFAGECFYDTTRGVPFFDQVFDGTTPVAILKAKMEAEAVTVPGVSAALAVLSTPVNRKIGGQIQITLNNGTTQTVQL